jgi:UDP-N-acetylglucosamine 2-epimerase (non-hydrolysing)
MILAVVGTRPEVIKMAPVIYALRQAGLAVELVTTGQHHDSRMMGSFLDSFGLEVDYPIPLPHRDLMGSFIDILAGLAPVFRTVRARHSRLIALAVGDTTTVLATAFVARKTGVAFGHIEAGLRAFTRELPEEEHRICADALGDLLFAPTTIAVDNLTRERVNGEIVLSGNTVLDALRLHPPAFVPIERREGIVVTIHRQETVDDVRRLTQVVGALRSLSRDHDVEWPLHPRTKASIASYRLEIPPTVTLTAPLGHSEFLDRLARARIVVSDSGGVQEEAAILGTPCVCVRDHTERPETIDAGVGLLAGTDTGAILRAAAEIEANWKRFARPVPELYGDGYASARIAVACANFLGEGNHRLQAIGQ